MQALFLAALDVSVRAASGQGYAPEDAARRMSVATGLEARLVACEPLVRQPMAIDFDDLGRLWVMQYLQYPTPSGFERVTIDRYARTTYDRVPEPPPRGPKGADCITILEDVDGDGRMDRAGDFMTGLNLTSGLAFGDGGVFVLQTPYLTAAFGTLARFEDNAIAVVLLAVYPQRALDWRSRAREVLLNRTAWAWAFLGAVEAGKIPAQDVTLEELSRFATLGSDELAVLVRNHWGINRGCTRSFPPKDCATFSALSRVILKWA